MPGFVRSTLALVAGLGIASEALTPVADHGALTVSGTHILDMNGKQTQLAGMSLFWSGWAGQFYNRATLSWLAYDWKISVVRIAMGVEGGGMYLDSSHGGDIANINRVDSVMQAAVDLGIYAIIDWHEENAPNHTAKSVAFFQRMARKWGAYPNVIYEIYNEPRGDVVDSNGDITSPAWVWDLSGAGPDIRSYAQTVVDSIRAIDPSNLILIGNETWDQNPNVAGADPVDGANILYTLHFYAGTHYFQSASGAGSTNGAARAAKAAIAQGTPIFMSEWGTSTADGGGGADKKIYTLEAGRWLAWAATNKISWCNWSLVNKTESSAALLPSAGPYGHWGDSVISPSGIWVRTQLQTLNAKYTFPEPPPLPVRLPDTVALPGRVQAEGFVDTSGVQIESGSDVDGTDDMGWIENGDWADYMVRVSQEGDFFFHARVASATLGGAIILLDSTKKELGRVVVPGTGGWQAWTTVTDSTQVHLLPGLQRLRISFQGTGTASLFNINWFQLDNTIASLRPKVTLTPFRVTARAGSILVKGADGFDRLTLLDSQGRILARCPVVSGAASLPNRRPGLAFAELSGHAGRRSLSLFVSK